MQEAVNLQETPVFCSAPCLAEEDVWGAVARGAPAQLSSVFIECGGRGSGWGRSRIHCMLQRERPKGSMD